ncbi:MAG: MATE family efflux transporter, partial [Fibrobacterota bacterium]
WQGIYVAFIGGSLVMLLYPASPWIFRMVGHAPVIQANECVYFQILCLAGIPAVLNAVLSAFFSGLGRTLPVMLVNLGSMVINLIFCYLLIFGKFGFPEMGMAGAGWAAVIAAFSATIVFCFLVFTRANDREYGILGAWRFDPALFSRLLRFGVPSGLHLIADAAAFTLFLLFVGHLGVVPLAATNIAFNINTIAFMPMIGLGITVSVLVGQFQGRNRPDLAARSVMSVFHMVFVYMVIVAASYVLIPDVFIYPYAAKSDPVVFPAIREMTLVLLMFVAFYSIFDSCNLVFASAIKGAGDTRYVMIMLAILSTVTFVIPVYLAIFVFHKGIYTAWIILTAYIFLLATSFTLRFFGGKWKRMRVIEEPIAQVPLGLPETPDSRV